MSQRPLLASLLVPVPTRHYSVRERELGTPSSAGYPAIRRDRVAAQTARGRFPSRCLSPWNSSGQPAGFIAGRNSSHYDLPRILQWFTGNIGYHHIHHLAPRIPNYRLRAAFESNPLLQSAPRLTLRTSLGCARLKLWDEERGCMVGLAAASCAGRRPSAG